MEVKFFNNNWFLVFQYVVFQEIMTDRSTYKPTDKTDQPTNQRADRKVHREATLSIIGSFGGLDRQFRVEF